MKSLSKLSKTERKEERFQSLERELAKQKKENVELLQQKTVRLNDEQLQCFLDQFTRLAELSTNRIINETPKTAVVHTTEKPSNDGFSFIIKWIIAGLFFTITAGIVYSLYSIWGDFWSAGLINRIVLFIISVAGFDCFILGIEIIKEKDRNYIISLFSALVALVALIVTLIK